MKLKTVTLAALGLAAGLVALPALGAECGTDKTIGIAEMTWPSAAALAHVHAFILEKGYGCTVEIVSGDTVPTSSSMLSKGTPAIAPELWTGTIQDLWDKGLKEGTVKAAGLAIKAVFRSEQRHEFHAGRIAEHLPSRFTTATDAGGIAQ